MIDPAAAPFYPPPPAPDPELIGLAGWDGNAPLILVVTADHMEPIAANYPKAHVVALPADLPPWLTGPDAWSWWMQLAQPAGTGTDVTLWPIGGADMHVLAPIAALIVQAGAKRLRWAKRRAGDWARYEWLETTWRARRPAYTADWLARAAAMLADGTSAHPTGSAGTAPASTGVRNETGHAAAA